MWPIVAFTLVLVAADQPCAPSSIMSEARNAEEVFLWGRGTVDGKNYDYIVTESVLAKTPEWLPEKQEPPLSIPAAMAIAKKVALADHPKFETVVAAAIEIRPASSYRSKNRWFYSLDFAPVLEGQPYYGNEITVVLLLDGTVVKPRERQAGHPQ
ncbi:MAG TPA: hypothetical protein VHQ90_00845 [Thermoanaerobaculia bacterium]|nr:hypothetical protein [Thermoanaerobaculia bacterium]